MTVNSWRSAQSAQSFSNCKSQKGAETNFSLHFASFRAVLYKVEIWLLTLSNEWRNERETCKLWRHVKTTKKLANFQSVDLFTRTLYSVQTNSFEREILIVKINRNISQFLPSVCHHNRKPFWKKNLARELFEAFLSQGKLVPFYSLCHMAEIAISKLLGT